VLEGGRLVGILTESDLYRSFVGLTGAARPSTRLMVQCEDSADGLARLFEILASQRARLVSVISPPVDQGRRHVLLRVALFNALPLVRALEEAGFPVETPADLDPGAAAERGGG
jgi:acetoin utilization protein AcuB